MTANVATRIIAPACLAVMAAVVLRPPAADPASRAEVVRPSVEPRIVAKMVVAREVRAGRLSPAEAAAVFHWLNRQPPALGAVDADPCGAVVTWVERSAGAEPFESTPERCSDRAAAPLPAAIEKDCREFLNRSAAAVQRQRGRPDEMVTVNDLRLVERRRD
jgi:hypothetical protein